MSREDFKTLVNDYGKQVLNTALRIVGDGQTAQDVHQQVFLRIWQRWHKYNGQTNWPGYLYRATVRQAIAAAKELKMTEHWDTQAECDSDVQRPDAEMRTAELQQKLAKALARLPKRQADVFVMSRIEGLKTETIAEFLGCSPNTVRVHLYRATRRIAAELGDYLTE